MHRTKTARPSPQFLASVQRYNPSADGNWRVRPVPGVKLRFRTGANAEPHLASQPTLRLVERHGDGSITLELQPVP